MSTVATAIVAPAVLLGTVVIFLLAAILYCWIRTTFTPCRWRSTENSGETHNEAVFTLSDTLPPSYSGLSVHTLPPSYSTACQIIGYRRSDESMTGANRNEGFDTDTQYRHTEDSTSNTSLNNVINFSQSASDDQISYHL